MAIDNRGLQESGGRLANVATGRVNHFATASRNSARVKLLRRAILFAACGGVLLLLLPLLNPFGSTPIVLDIRKLGLSGNKITMDHPKLTGEKRDGRPYELHARSGIQDPHEPNKIELVDLDARLQLGEEGQTHVLAEHGYYDSSRDTLDLKGKVHIISPTYDLALQSAAMDFKSGALRSQQPVNVKFSGGVIESDAMEMIDDGAKVTFLGKAHSILNQDGEADDSPALKGTP